MRWAFVVQLTSETRAAESHFEGWAEEVDTGQERRFRSTEELLAFLGDCYEAARRRGRKPVVGKKEEKGT
jgi:hypothetical protein